MIPFGCLRSKSWREKCGKNGIFSTPVVGQTFFLTLLLKNKSDWDDSKAFIC